MLLYRNYYILCVEELKEVLKFSRSLLTVSRPLLEWINSLNERHLSASLTTIEGTRYSSPVSKKLEFSNRFSKNTQISNFMKIRTVEDGFVPCGGQTDCRKLTVAFRIFTNAPSNSNNNNQTHKTTRRQTSVRIIKKEQKSHPH